MYRGQGESDARTLSFTYTHCRESLVDTHEPLLVTYYPLHTVYTKRCTLVGAGGALLSLGMAA